MSKNKSILHSTDLVLLEEYGTLLLKRVELLKTQEELAKTLKEVSSRVEKLQAEHLQNTCTHDEYDMVDYDTSNKYSGWGKYKCKKCPHTRTRSF
jgi:hypothetical protein